MVNGSTPYVGMTPKKNGGHIKSVQMNVYLRLVKGLHEPYQALSSASMSNGTVIFDGEHRKVPNWEVAKTGKSSIF